MYVAEVYFSLLIENRSIIGGAAILGASLDCYQS
jgi:hypothetical protein